MNKSQQMRWSRQGANLLLQVRCAIYNGTLGSGHGQRFHPANDTHPRPQAIAACPPNLRRSLDIGSLSVILPILKPLMHLSAVQVGMLAASSAVGFTIAMIPTGLLADRFGRKHPLIGGVLWFVGLTLVSALAPDFWTLLMLRGLSGLGMAPTFIMPYAFVSELVSSRTRAAFAGVLEASLGLTCE
jgi:MFS family permease